MTYCRGGLRASSLGNFFSNFDALRLLLVTSETLLNLTNLDSLELSLYLQSEAFHITELSPFHRKNFHENLICVISLAGPDEPHESLPPGRLLCIISPEKLQRT